MKVEVAHVRTDIQFLLEDPSNEVLNEIWSADRESRALEIVDPGAGIDEPVQVVIRDCSFYADADRMTLSVNATVEWPTYLLYRGNLVQRIEVGERKR